MDNEELLRRKLVGHKDESKVRKEKELKDNRIDLVWVMVGKVVVAIILWLPVIIRPQNSGADSSWADPIVAISAFLFFAALTFTKSIEAESKIGLVLSLSLDLILFCSMFYWM